MSNIKVALDKIRKENTKLQASINDFKGYDKAYIENMISSLDGMHSDYINKLKNTLTNMADTKAPQMIEQAQKYSFGIRKTVDAFEEEDNEVATVFKK